MPPESPSWTDLSLMSERAARAAGLAAARGGGEAPRLYGQAADLAELALAALPGPAARSYAATAVSAAWLRRRAGQTVDLFRLAGDVLAHPALPAYARCEIQAALSSTAAPGSRLQ